MFYRLYDLCELNPVKDLVIDAMHAIVLNLIRTELENHLLADLGSNATLSPMERDPAKGGVLERSSLREALAKVKWTTELKEFQPLMSKDINLGIGKLKNFRSLSWWHQLFSEG